MVAKWEQLLSIGNQVRAPTFRPSYRRNASSPGRLQAIVSTRPG
jgi:hypothetical protein